MLADPLAIPQSDAPTFLRMSAVVERTGLSRSTIYRFVSKNAFPTPVKLGPRAIAWRRSDVEIWSASRPSSRYGKSSDPGEQSR